MAVRRRQIGESARMINKSTIDLQRWSGEWSSDALLGTDDPDDGYCLDRTGASCPKFAAVRAKQALAERQVVELSHRFVNMLQTLASGIQRDRRAHGGPTRENDLERLVASIHASGRLHRYLLPNRTDLPIDLSSLLLNVATAIEGAIGLQCHVDVAPIVLPNEVTMHLAAAVYELAWNAHKHAYAGKAGGVIRVVCRRDADRRVVLSVADQGRGLPVDFDPRASKGLGLMLVCDVVRQFSGDLRIESDRGACFIMRLNVP